MSGRTWQQGDFTYDGRVNLDDFNALAANFGLSAGANGPTAADWSALAAAVPEPPSMSVVLAAGMLARRRHRESRGMGASSTRPAVAVASSIA
jgi:hypothetical protein